MNKVKLDFNFDLEEWLNTGALMSTGPDQLLIAYGKRSSLRTPDKHAESFYCPDFFLSEAMPWSVYEFCHEVNSKELIHILESIVAKEVLIPLDWILPDRAQFRKTFKDIQEQFAKGNLLKAVPYVFYKNTSMMTFKRLALSLLNAIRYAETESVYLYGNWNENGGILGATPEILFSITKEEKYLQTMACAGTCPSNDSNMLLQDPKQRKEHQLVVDEICASLAPFGILNVGQITLLNLPTLSHLITPIRLEFCRDVTFDALVSAIHPTPALGAFPRKGGLEWLKHYQTIMNRERFGAPIGYIRSDGTANCFVAIRNVQWNHSGLAIGTGCGIIPESNFEQEWQEINLKFHSIKRILGYESSHIAIGTEKTSRNE